MVLNMLFYFFHIFGGLYWLRLLWLSKLFIIKTKIGEYHSLPIICLYYMVLLLVSGYLAKAYKSKLYYFLFVLAFLYFITFVYGRYAGVYLTFGEYIGKVGLKKDLGLCW